MKNLLVLLMIMSSIYSCDRKDLELSNLVVFAKAYGYIKYFHPSDESNKIDWAKFSAFGSKKIIECTSKQQLVNTLNKLFNPIAPTVKFLLNPYTPTYDLSLITPDNLSDYRLTYWQHKGVSIGMSMPNQYQAYRSIRINRTTSPDDGKLFDF